MKIKKILKLITTTFNYWSEDKVSHLSAALSYYTVFSLVPILVICIAVTGLVFDQDLITHQVLNQIGGVLGKDAAAEIKLLIDNTYRPSTDILATVLGVVTLIWGALGLFTEL